PVYQGLLAVRGGSVRPVRGCDLRLQAEKGSLRDWLTEDDRRSRATWTNNRRYSLLWEFDGKHHSPSGLVMTMYELAGWEDSPVAVQGPARWYIEGERMDRRAERILEKLEEE
ncbi:hypothetical protein ABZ631_18915, partial [Nocardiopsis alba]